MFRPRSFLKWYLLQALVFSSTPFPTKVKSISNLHIPSTLRNLIAHAKVSGTNMLENVWDTVLGLELKAIPAHCFGASCS
jgi:hypothetical protein